MNNKSTSFSSVLDEFRKYDYNLYFLPGSRDYGQNVKLYDSLCDRLKEQKVKQNNDNVSTILSRERAEWCLLFTAHIRPNIAQSTIFLHMFLKRNNTDYIFNRYHVLVRLCDYRAHYNENNQSDDDNSDDDDDDADDGDYEDDNNDDDEVNNNDDDSEDATTSIVRNKTCKINNEIQSSFITMKSNDIANKDTKSDAYNYNYKSNENDNSDDEDNYKVINYNSNRRRKNNHNKNNNKNNYKNNNEINYERVHGTDIKYNSKTGFSNGYNNDVKITDYCKSTTSGISGIDGGSTNFTKIKNKTSIEIEKEIGKTRKLQNKDTRKVRCRRIERFISLKNLQYLRHCVSKIQDKEMQKLFQEVLHDDQIEAIERCAKTCLNQLHDRSGYLWEFAFDRDFILRMYKHLGDSPLIVLMFGLTNNLPAIKDVVLPKTCPDRVFRATDDLLPSTFLTGTRSTDTSMMKTRTDTQTKMNTPLIQTTTKTTENSSKIGTNVFTIAAHTNFGSISKTDNHQHDNDKAGGELLFNNVYGPPGQNRVERKQRRRRLLPQRSRNQILPCREHILIHKSDGNCLKGISMKLISIFGDHATKGRKLNEKKKSYNKFNRHRGSYTNDDNDDYDVDDDDDDNNGRGFDNEYKLHNINDGVHLNACQTSCLCTICCHSTEVHDTHSIRNLYNPYSLSNRHLSKPTCERTVLQNGEYNSHNKRTKKVNTTTAFVDYRIGTKEPQSIYTLNMNYFKFLILKVKEFAPLYETYNRIELTRFNEKDSKIIQKLFETVNHTCLGNKKPSPNASSAYNFKNFLTQNGKTLNNLNCNPNVGGGGGTGDGENDGGSSSDSSDDSTIDSQKYCSACIKNKNYEYENDFNGSYNNDKRTTETTDSSIVWTYSRRQIAEELMKYSDCPTMRENARICLCIYEQDRPFVFSRILFFELKRSFYEHSHVVYIFMCQLSICNCIRDNTQMVKNKTKTLYNIASASNYDNISVNDYAATDGLNSLSQSIVLNKTANSKLSNFCTQYHSHCYTCHHHEHCHTLNLNGTCSNETDSVYKNFNIDSDDNVREEGGDVYNENIDDINTTLASLTNTLNDSVDFSFDTKDSNSSHTSHRTLLQNRTTTPTVRIDRIAKASDITSTSNNDTLSVVETNLHTNDTNKTKRYYPSAQGCLITQDIEKAICNDFANINYGYCSVNSLTDESVVAKKLLETPRNFGHISTEENLRNKLVAVNDATDTVSASGNISDNNYSSRSNSCSNSNISVASGRHGSDFILTKHEIDILNNVSQAENLDAPTAAVAVDDENIINVSKSTFSPNIAKTLLTLNNKIATEQCVSFNTDDDDDNDYDEFNRKHDKRIVRLYKDSHNDCDGIDNQTNSTYSGVSSKNYKHIY